MNVLTALEEIIQKGESETLEFKKSTSLLNGVAETPVAFRMEKEEEPNRASLQNNKAEITALFRLD